MIRPREKDGQNGLFAVGRESGQWQKRCGGERGTVTASSVRDMEAVAVGLAGGGMCP